MFDDRGEILRGSPCLHAGAGVREVIEDRTVGKERTAGHEDNPGGGAAIGRDIGDPDGAVESQIEDDDIRGDLVQHVERGGVAICNGHDRPVVLERQIPASSALLSAIRTRIAGFARPRSRGIVFGPLEGD